MGNLKGFDANQFEPNKAFEPIPTAWYKVAIVESEMKETKKKDGKFLELTLEVLEGPHKGRKVWDRLNLMNPNPKAVDIARGTLSAICHAVNKMRPDDSAELHNIPLDVRVAAKVRKDNVEVGNEVKGYRPPKDGAGSAGAPAQQGQEAPAGTGKETAPW